MNSLKAMMRRLPNGAASFATAAGGEKLFVKDLVKTAAEKAGMSQKETKRVVNAVFKTISEAVIKGEEVSLTGFGKFAPVTRAARRSRHVVTGNEIQIPPKVSPVFRPSKVFKEAVNSASR